MTDRTTPAIAVIRNPSPVGERELFPGLTVLTMPRAQGVAELDVAAQPFACLIYARRARDLRTGLAPGLDDRRIRARSLTLLAPGQETRWVYRDPVHDDGAGLQTLHLRVTDAFGDTLERRAALDSLRSAMNLQVPGLRRRMEQAMAAFEAPDAFRSVALQSAGFAAALLMLDPASARATAEASSLTARRRRALVAYVDDNLAGEVTLAGMADAVGLSPWHFVRVFKAATGQTPYAWVVARRVDRVKQALQRGNGTLSEVATACGFASQSHMTEVFRRTVGVTPGRWRANLRSTLRQPLSEDDS